MYLLDTNMISEMRRVRPHGAVKAWIEAVDSTQLYLSAVTIGEIQAGIDAAPVPLPAVIDPSMKYMPVIVSGQTTGQEILVLSGTKERGGGYNVISAFVTEDGRRILLDRGFIDQVFDVGPEDLGGGSKVHRTIVDFFVWHFGQ